MGGVDISILFNAVGRLMDLVAMIVPCCIYHAKDFMLASLLLRMMQLPHVSQLLYQRVWDRFLVVCKEIIL